MQKEKEICRPFLLYSPFFLPLPAVIAPCIPAKARNAKKTFRRQKTGKSNVTKDAENVVKRDVTTPRRVLLPCHDVTFS